MIIPDTDGLLDRCKECGARAGFVELPHISSWYGQCTKCASSGSLCIDATEAMIAWNKEQRGIDAEA